MNLNLTLTEILTTVPASLFWICFALASGLLLVTAVIKTTFYIVRDNSWKEYALYWERWTNVFIRATAMSGIPFVIVAGINWANLWRTVPFISSAWSVGVEAVIIGITLLLSVLVRKKPETITKRNVTMTWLLGLSFNLTLWWPIAVSAWMECPLGTFVNAPDLTLGFSHLSWIVFSPLAALKFFHMVASCWVIGAVFLVSLSCRHLLQHTQEKARTGIIAGSALAILAMVLTMCIGDSTGYTVSKQQPMKMAAIQQVDKGGKEMAFSIIGPVKVPKMLSRLATHSNFGFFPGMDDVAGGGYRLPEGGVAKSLTEKHGLANHALQIRQDIKDDYTQQLFRYESQYIGYSQLNSPARLKPQTQAYYWAFRIMIGAGLLLIVLLAGLIYALVQEKAPWREYLLRINSYTYLLALCCTLCGWFIAEFGKYPWAVTDLLTAEAAVSAYPIYIICIELAVMLALCMAIIRYMFRLIKKNNL